MIDDNCKDNKDPNLTVLYIDIHYPDYCTIFEINEESLKEKFENNLEKFFSDEDHLSYVKESKLVRNLSRFGVHSVSEAYNLRSFVDIVYITE